MLEQLVMRTPEADRSTWRRRLRRGTPEAEAWRAEQQRRYPAYLERLRPEQAALVRRLRVDEGYSYRALAAACYAAWDAEARRILWGEERPGFPWIEPSNQGVGIELCAAAAAHFGEDLQQPPWR